ncbi:MAG: exodeoxyribonuclease VII large subunit [Culturomica sp.]|jgi:exodeoxyribonuclease VII large subunit|nr:exodeoxyribonuclease VII large subunit [Culturomica sp.]
MNALSLYELNLQIKSVLKREFPFEVWVTAEITGIQENRSGHCYLELADKPEGDDKKTNAVARATIWSYNYGMLRSYFMSQTGRNLEKGMKILVCVEVVFHEIYGLSLNVKDIDPTYTVGDLERKRKEILARLEKEGVADMNRILEFPYLPKNVAVISSPTAAGYGDFTKHLYENPYGFAFNVVLYPATMQGETAAASIIAALEHIYEEDGRFDLVVIIRGGGSQSDLGVFDDYELALNIAQFPLPVIAGIGHERDKSIVDYVAFESVKTPTAAAALLVDYFLSAESDLNVLKDKFFYDVRDLITNNRSSLSLISQKVAHGTEKFLINKRKLFSDLSNRMGRRIETMLNKENNAIDNNIQKLKQKTKEIIISDRHKLNVAETTVKYVDPAGILARGYSITKMNGKVLKDLNVLHNGAVIETIMQSGRIESEVKIITKK